MNKNNHSMNKMIITIAKKASEKVATISTKIEKIFNLTKTETNKITMKNKKIKESHLMLTNLLLLEIT